VLLGSDKGNTQQQEWGPLKISTPVQTQTQINTVNTYVANIHNKLQEPTDTNVPYLRILMNIFKIIKIHKDEIHIVSSYSVTALQIKRKTRYIVYFTAQPM